MQTNFFTFNNMLSFQSISKEEAGERHSAKSYFIMSGVTTTLGIFAAIMGAAQFVVYVLLRLKHMKELEN